jgi:DmsE family decaheme c-type cytochrome
MKRFIVPGLISTAFILAALMSVVASPVQRGKEVDWTALNPNFAGATFVNDRETCLTCHSDSHPYDLTAHARAFGANPRNPVEQRDCEACHGPRSEHVENPGIDLAISPAGETQVCMQCHDKSSRLHWQHSAHARAEVECTSCHTVMVKRSESGLLAQRSEPETCYQCHSDVRASMHKASHHPVREGKMSCSSCHDPHGSPAEFQLARATVNETCYQCHSEKRGPFLWEHAPVRESCTTCHDAHGSNNRSMTQAKGSMQCLTCHQYGGHINTPRYNRTSALYGQGCVNCHITPHGSNHPAGAKLTR